MFGVAGCCLFSIPRMKDLAQADDVFDHMFSGHVRNRSTGGTHHMFGLRAKFQGKNCLSRPANSAEIFQQATFSPESTLHVVGVLLVVFKPDPPKVNG